MKKKLISLFLVLALVVGICPAAFAAENSFGDGVEPYAATSRKTYEDFICVLPGCGELIPPDFEVYVKVTGNYEVDTVEDIITKVSQSSPMVEVVGFGNIISGVVTYTATNVQRKASFTSSRATFSTTFDLYYTAGTDFVKGYCGTYSITIVGDVNGGRAISCTPADRYVYSTQK